jgi:hypothetical protein
MNGSGKYEGLYMYEAGDYVIQDDKDGIKTGKIVEILTSLPGPAYKVDFPDERLYKRRLECQLRLDTAAQSVCVEECQQYLPSLGAVAGDFVYEIGQLVKHLDNKWHGQKITGYTLGRDKKTPAYKVEETWALQSEITLDTETPITNALASLSESGKIQLLSFDELSQLRDGFERVVRSKHEGIRSGTFCEVVLEAGIFRNCNEKELLQSIAEKNLRVCTEVCKRAIELYCQEGEKQILAHYRHPHSNPNQLFQFGAFVKLVRNESRQKKLIIEYESKDRVTYGNRPQSTEFTNLRDALGEIGFLDDHFWYANFIHPDAYGKLPRLQYRGPEGGFVSWKERAGHGF